MLKIITWCPVELRGWIQGSDSQSRHNMEWQIGVVDVHWDKILICHAWLSPRPPSHITHDHFCDGGHHVTAGMVTSHRQDSSAWTLTHPALISCPGCPPGSHHSASTASVWLTSQNIILIFLELSANLIRSFIPSQQVIDIIRTPPLMPPTQDKYTNCKHKILIQIFRITLQINKDFLWSTDHNVTSSFHGGCPDPLRIGWSLTYLLLTVVTKFQLFMLDIRTKRGVLRTSKGKVGPGWHLSPCPHFICLF